MSVAAKIRRERYVEQERAYHRAYYLAHRDRIKAKVRARSKEKDRCAYKPQKDPADERIRRAGLEISEDDPKMSLDEIALRLGLTRARVGQILQTALRKLRRNHPHMVELLP